MFCIFTDENQTVIKTFDITTDYKVTELFCIIDEFCKHFIQLASFKCIGESYFKKCSTFAKAKVATIDLKLQLK